MKKLLLVSMSVLVLAALFSTTSAAVDPPLGTEMNVSITISNYSEVVKTPPPMVTSKGRMVVTRSDIEAMRPKTHFEAIKLANNYLNETLGSSFVSEHFECLGIEESSVISHIWWVIYKYRSNGYEMNMSIAISKLVTPMGVIEGSGMMGSPQEIKLSAEDAEAIASDKGLDLPNAGELVIEERTRRIVWIVRTQKTPTEDMETIAYSIDAENGDVLGDAKYIPRMPMPEKVGNKAQTHRSGFIPYSEIIRNIRQTTIPPLLPPVETPTRKNITTSEKPLSVPSTGMEKNLSIADASALNQTAKSQDNHSIKSIQQIFFEDFEGSFPADNWVVADSNPDSGGDYWDDTTHRDYEESRSCYCADVSDTGVNYKYDDNAHDYMIRKYLIDASNWNSATLSYYSWYKIESGCDYLRVIVTGDGGSHWYEIGDKLDGSIGWGYHSVNIPAEYLTSQFSIGFLFYSDSSVTYEGAYVDTIELDAEIFTGDIRITSVSWYSQIFMNEARETTTQAIEIHSLNDDSSTHKLYTKLNVTHASGQTHTLESSHNDVPPGYMCNTTFYFDFTNAYIEKATFDVELWEDIWLLPDVRHDIRDDDEVYRFHIIFEWPDGVSDDYRCEDIWHHPWDFNITETAVDNATYTTSHYLAINYLMGFVDDWMTYNSSDPWGDRSSDIDILLYDKKGDCKDYTDLYIGLARSLNIPGSLVIRVTQPDKSCIQRVPLEVKIYALEQMFDV